MKLVNYNMYIDDKKNISEQLELSALVFEESIEGIMITDAENKIIKVNDAFVKMTGYRQKEIAGCRANILKSDVHNSSFYYKMWKKLEAKGQWRGEIWNRTKNSQPIACFVSIKVLYDVDGNVKNYIAMYLDITEKKHTQDELFHLAYHDTLTKLPNRTQFNQHITTLINHYDREEKEFAVLFLDLDNFKYVNDSYGHNIGDLLLIKVAKIFKSVLRNVDFVARLGGDEFTVVIDDYQNIKQIQTLCKRIIEKLAQPLEIRAKKLSIGCSIGVAVYPKDGITKNALIKNADTAMYESKHNGKNIFTFHTKQMNEELHRKMQLDNGIREALALGEFEMHYQAKLATEDKSIIGAEALIRWNSPSLGNISAIELISYAEESGLIKEIGNFILENVFESVALLEKSFGSIVVSINISSLQLQDSEFIYTVMSLLKKTKVNPKMIEFEITETKIMHNIEENIEKLLRLKRLGIGISIDDFGTGYSSMSYLQKLPIDIIKIDKSFIDEIHLSNDSEILVKAIVSLSKALNLKTVAEGVEVQAQLEHLQNIGCDYIQGYLYSKPLPLKDFTELLKDGVIHK